MGLNQNKKKNSLASIDKNIQSLRKKIRRLDNKLVNLVSQRMLLTDQIGKSKKQANYPVRNIALEKQMLNDRAAWGKKMKLQPQFVKSLFRLLISYSVVRQQMIIRGK